MAEMNKKKNDEIEIDLGRLFRAILKRAWLIGAVSVLCAVLVALGTLLFATPMYESSAMFYVNNGSLSQGGSSSGISSGDLTVSRNLVESYIIILNTRESLNEVIDYAGVDYSYKTLKKMISSSAVNNTEIFEVVVSSPDPQEAQEIASAIAHVLPQRISSIIENSSAKVVGAATTPTEPSSPSYIKNTIIGFLIGFVLVVGFIVLRMLLDVTIHSEEDVAQVCHYPILAQIPDMASGGKGSAYQGYGEALLRKTKGKFAAGMQSEPPTVIGSGVNFAASEAYKLLRTKVQFSFADENDCHVIGLSSALSDEGKSVTAVNLAFALSQLNKKVLLVDCDMRRPTLAEKLEIRKYPGLSSYLTRQCGLDELLQKCNIKGHESAFHVITAGQNPPNPVELLSSDRMKKALTAMRAAYDYVILDLPPVGEVSDAMAIAKETDGILLVVRENYCNRVVLADALQHFEFIQAKLLGVIVNCTSERSGKYGTAYYKRYYENHGRSVAHAVAANGDEKAE